MILSRADVLRAARFTGTPTADDNTRADDIAAAVDVFVASAAGPTSGTLTYTGPCRGGAIVLPWRYSAITSVTVTATSLATTVVPAAQYDTTDALNGILRAVPGYSAWSTGLRVTVVATAVTAAANVKLAAITLARHWWQLDQNGGRGAWADENGTPVTAGVPAAVREQLAATPGMPGFG